jgi:DNA-binding response OmpR family regulator
VIVDAAAPLVVLIEDDETSAFLFREALTSHGYAVRVSDGGDGDLAAVQALQPAALLVDLHLGDTDGLQLLRRLRAVRSLRQVPAAVITGDYFTDARVSRELETLGIEMHLKPLWNDELLRIVGSLLKRPPHRTPATPEGGDDIDGRRAHP